MDDIAVIDLSAVDAVLFDMDGVVTDTARVHAAAWKHAFDEFLRGEGLEPFHLPEDYLRYVDGRPRLDGVRRFLAARGIELPEGSVADPPAARTVQGLGAAKDAYFVDQVDRYGVAAFPSSITLLHELRRRGGRTSVVSVSRNCAKVVASTGVAHLFDDVVDGLLAARMGLPGVPDPALFLEAARRLAVPPSRTAVVEDALPGLEAARRGDFAVVIGVDRMGQGGAVQAAGADVVVSDLAEIRATGRVPVTQ